MAWGVTWYKIGYGESIATDSSWLGDVVGVSCYDLVPDLQCGDQFGVKLDVAVRWQTVLFGLGSYSETDPGDPSSYLRLSDVAVGAVHCQPHCDVDVYPNMSPAGPGRCNVAITFLSDCTYDPRIRILVGTVVKLDKPLSAVDQPAIIDAPEGSTLIIEVYYGDYVERTIATVSCPITMEKVDDESLA